MHQNYSIYNNIIMYTRHFRRETITLFMKWENLLVTSFMPIGKTLNWYRLFVVIKPYISIPLSVTGICQYSFNISNLLINVALSNWSIHSSNIGTGYQSFLLTENLQLFESDFWTNKIGHSLSVCSIISCINIYKMSPFSIFKLEPRGV